MCDPFSIVVGALGVASSVKKSRDAKKARKEQRREGERVKRVAANERRSADLDTREERRGDFSRRRRSRSQQDQVANNGSNGLFSPRSFFQA